MPYFWELNDFQTQSVDNNWFDCIQKAAVEMNVNDSLFQRFA